MGSKPKSSAEELIKAALLLKSNCNINCDCPFSSGNVCLISEYEAPANWQIGVTDGK